MFPNVVTRISGLSLSVQSTASFDIAEIHLGTTELCLPEGTHSLRDEREARRTAASAVGEEALMLCHLSNHCCKATVQAHIVAGLAAWQLV